MFEIKALTLKVIKLEVRVVHSASIYCTSIMYEAQRKLPSWSCLSCEEDEEIVGIMS